MATPTPKPDYVLSTFVRCSPDALWAALTDPEIMSRYHFLSDCVLREGEAYRYVLPGGAGDLTCRVLASDPTTRLETTFEPGWAGGGAPSRTVFLVRPERAACRLTVEHYNLTFPVVPGEGVVDGWERWAAGLKTFLETGETVRFNDEVAA